MTRNVEAGSVLCVCVKAEPLAGSGPIQFSDTRLSLQLSACAAAFWCVSPIGARHANLPSNAASIKDGPCSSAACAGARFAGYDGRAHKAQQ